MGDINSTNLLLVCIDLHVLLSEWRNGTCASPIDFIGIKRALLCFGFEKLVGVHV